MMLAGEARALWRYVLQFQPSGLRVKCLPVVEAGKVGNSKSFPRSQATILSTAPVARRFWRRMNRAESIQSEPRGIDGGPSVDLFWIIPTAVCKSLRNKRSGFRTAPTGPAVVPPHCNLGKEDRAS